MRSRKINLNIEVEVIPQNGIYEIVVTSGNVRNVMPARTLEEAEQTAIATVAPFSQFVLGQELKS